MRHFLTIKETTKKELLSLVKKAGQIKKNPRKYARALQGKTLLMVFEAPSLRTRLSFEAAMLGMGGHAIFYTTGESTLGKKESMKDFSKVESRYVDVVMARLFEHSGIEELARYSDVPVINGMTNAEHPCQIVGDLLTMYEKKKIIKKIAYVGDCNNNVTNSLLYAAAKLGISAAIAGPKGAEFEGDAAVLRDCKNMGGSVQVFDDAKKAVAGADFVHTDSWMSYRVPKEREPERAAALRPFQVNAALMRGAPNAYFMHCLPAKRGAEVTDDVIDSTRSIVYDQAENRMHAEKAILLWLLKK